MLNDDLRHRLWLASLDLCNACANLDRIAGEIERCKPLTANAKHIRKVSASMFKDRQAIMAEVDPTRKLAATEGP